MTTEVSTMNFPHAVLTPLANQRPTVSALEILRQELNTNAISIPSNRGNGLLGLYALVVSPATYTAAAGVVFNPPTNPGIAPIIPVQATIPMITELNRQFLADNKEFMIYKSTEASLKKLLLEAVPSTYVNKLKDKSLGFATVTTLMLIEHLIDTYGTITTDDLDKNMALLHKDWSPSTPIEDLFEQIRVCREFAFTIDAISESTAVRAGLSNLEKTGVFTDSIRDWRKLPDAQKTLVTFITHFTLADAERHRIITTKTAGYHHMAAAATTTAPTGTTSGNLYYCWTHGAGHNSDHVSSTCKTPQAGHRSEATFYNMLGGNNLIHRLRGEKQVFVPPPRRNPTTTPTPAPNAAAATV
jgi:hypothetical protein